MVAKRAARATLASDKISFKLKTITRDKEGHYISVIVTGHQEDVTVVTKHVLNSEAPT